MTIVIFSALTCSYECTIGIEPCKANAFLVTVTGEAMVAFAIDGHFDRHVMIEFLSILRTFGIRDSLVSLGEKTTTREGFLIKLCYNLPIPRPGLSPHSQYNVAFTRFHVHGQRLVRIHRIGFSNLSDCPNSHSQSVYLGLH